MGVPSAPSAGVREVHVSVKRSRDYQAVELSAVYALEPGSDAGDMLAKIEELYGVLSEDADDKIADLAGRSKGPESVSIAELLSDKLSAEPEFHDTAAWEKAKPAAAPAAAEGDFLFASKPDKAKGPKQFRYLPTSVVSKRDLEDASKVLAAQRGFALEDVIAFDNRDRLDKPGWGACVVKARRGSALADRLDGKDTVGYTAWNAEGKLVLDVWAKV